MTADPSAKITVHHLNNSRSQRILWLLEELGVAYEVIRYERDPRTMLAPARLRKVHPLGKSPVITVDGETIAETGLIVEYLCDRFDDGRLSPPMNPGAMTKERQRWLYWLHYAEGSTMPMLLLKLVFNEMPTQAPWPLRFLVKLISKQGQDEFIDPQLALHLDYMEAALADTGWFGGPQFSAVDVMMSFPIEGASGFGLIGKRSRLADFVARIHSRPAYLRALDRGGSYSLA